MRRIDSGLFLEESLNFEYVEGGISSVTSPYTTGWRTLPYSVICQWRGTRVRLDYGTTDSKILAAEEGLIIPANLRHCVSTLSETPAVCHWAHVRYSVLGSISLLSMLDGPISCEAGSGNAVGDLLGSLAEIGDDTEFGFNLAQFSRRKRVGFQLLEEICQIAPLQELSMVFFRRSSRLLPVLQFVYENLGSEINREIIADKVGVSPTHFHTLFKRIMGIAPMDYVRGLRLQRSQALLVETDLTVAEIGERVGFGDPFYFSRQFKSLCGVSPSKYREDTRGSLFPPSENASV